MEKNSTKVAPYSQHYLCSFELFGDYRMGVVFQIMFDSYLYNSRVKHNTGSVSFSAIKLEKTISFGHKSVKKSLVALEKAGVIESLGNNEYAVNVSYYGSVIGLFSYSNSETRAMIRKAFLDNDVEKLEKLGLKNGFSEAGEVERLSAGSVLDPRSNDLPTLGQMTYPPRSNDLPVNKEEEINKKKKHGPKALKESDVEVEAGSENSNVTSSDETKASTGSETSSDMSSFNFSSSENNGNETSSDEIETVKITAEDVEEAKIKSILDKRLPGKYKQFTRNEIKEILEDETEGLPAYKTIIRDIADLYGVDTDTLEADCEDKEVPVKDFITDLVTAAKNVKEDGNYDLTEEQLYNLFGFDVDCDSQDNPVFVLDFTKINDITCKEEAPRKVRSSKKRHGAEDRRARNIFQDVIEEIGNQDPDKLTNAEYAIRLVALTVEDRRQAGIPRPDEMYKGEFDMALDKWSEETLVNVNDFRKLFKDFPVRGNIITLSVGRISPEHIFDYNAEHGEDSSVEKIWNERMAE